MQHGSLLREIIRDSFPLTGARAKYFPARGGPSYGCTSSWEASEFAPAILHHYDSGSRVANLSDGHHAARAAQMIETLRTGIPKIAELDQLQQSDTYNRHTAFNREFLTRHDAALEKYGRHWGKDPFKLWSRRWE